MAILISTSMYHSGNFKNILHFADKYKGKVGVEIFPRFDEPEFEKVLKECIPGLKKVPISIHEQIKLNDQICFCSGMQIYCLSSQ